MQIKNIRMARGMTQQQLADKLNIERTSIANWEAETTLPRARQIPVLAEVLGCTIDELFGRDTGQGSA